MTAKSDPSEQPAEDSLTPFQRRLYAEIGRQVRLSDGRLVTIVAAGGPGIPTRYLNQKQEDQRPNLQE